LLAGCLQAGEIAEAEQLLTAIKDAFERLGSPESAWAVFTKAAWQLFQEYIARERLDAAAVLAGDIGGMLWRSHLDEPFFAAFQEEVADELRRAGMVYRELEIGEAATRLLGKFLAPTDKLKTLPKRPEDCDADAMFALAEVMSWHMRAYLACGAVQRAARIHDFILRIAQSYPDRQPLWLASLQAANALIEKYGAAQNLLRAEALGREAIAICGRFPNCAEFKQERLAILRTLHRAQLQHDGLAKTEESLAELRRLADENPDDYAVRVWLAGPLCRQLAHHVAFGHIQPVWPLLDELFKGYEAFPYAAMWEPLDQATAALGEFFLTHDLVDCLGNMIDSIAGLRQRLPNDRNLGILWIRAAHSFEVAKANMIGQTDAPSGEHPGQPSDGLDVTAAMLN
jgi:tetratricopeptide (TPR) repeat protein